MTPLTTKTSNMTLIDVTINSKGSVDANQEKFALVLALRNGTPYVHSDEVTVRVLNVEQDERGASLGNSVEPDEYEGSQDETVMHMQSEVIAKLQAENERLAAGILGIRRAARNELNPSMMDRVTAIDCIARCLLYPTKPA